MIGLYTNNSHTQNELCRLLQTASVENYHPDHSYKTLIWLSNKTPPAGTPVLTLKDVSLPLSLTEWRQLIQQSITSTLYYQNKYFAFNASQRRITHLKTQKQIDLTEKENALLIFLCQTPSHITTKEDVLHNVWQYSPEAETHTLESHIYALKQKLGVDAEQLIQLKNGLIQLK